MQAKLTQIPPKILGKSQIEVAWVDADSQPAIVFGPMPVKTIPESQKWRSQLGVRLIAEQGDGVQASRLSREDPGEKLVSQKG